MSTSNPPDTQATLPSTPSRPRLAEPLYDPSADPSFGGRLVWTIEPITLKVELSARAKAKALVAAGALDAEWQDEAENFFILLGCTKGLEYRPRAHDHSSFQAFQDFIQKWNKPSQEMATDSYAWVMRTELPYQLITAWRAAYVQGQYGWANPNELPTYALRPDQAEEAKAKNSPLAKAAGRTSAK